MFNMYNKKNRRVATIVLAVILAVAMLIPMLSYVIK